MSTHVDSVVVGELLKYTWNNAGDPTARHRADFEKNLIRKWSAGTYDRAQAPKLWRYFIERVAAPGYGIKWTDMNKATRTAAMEAFAEYYDKQLRSGEAIREHPDWVPKKYRKAMGIAAGSRRQSQRPGMFTGVKRLPGSHTTVGSIPDSWGLVQLDSDVDDLLAQIGWKGNRYPYLFVAWENDGLTMRQIFGATSLGTSAIATKLWEDGKIVANPIVGISANGSAINHPLYFWLFAGHTTNGNPRWLAMVFDHTGSVYFMPTQYKNAGEVEAKFPGAIEHYIGADYVPTIPKFYREAESRWFKRFA